MSVPVITVAQMREWEQATWKAGRTQEDVISRVGHLVSHHARKLTRRADCILILAGKGHNGDDARHISQNLAHRDLFLINVTDDPASSLQEFNSQLLVSPALIVDGLFGIGLNRRLSEDWIELIEAINRANTPILSIDVPSGLNADTGEPQGAAIRAAITVTLGAPKRGLLAPSAWPYVGRLEVVPDIGLVPCSQSSELTWVLSEDFENFPPHRQTASHKGTYGHAIVLAGSLGYHGAAVLAARGAIRAQPGLVTVYTTEKTYIPVASQLQMPMVHPWNPGVTMPKTATAFLCGPGLAADDLPDPLQKQVCTLWEESPHPVIIDASALSWLGKQSNPGPGPRVLTPHPGEAARMLGCSSADVQADRPSSVRELSKRHGNCWVVLKGHQTLIGRSAGELYVNSSGNPWLAQGGSGDLLSGYLAGLLAQPRLQQNILQTLSYGVWQHGATADYLSLRQRNWTIDELANALGSSGAS